MPCFLLNITQGKGHYIMVVTLTEELLKKSTPESCSECLMALAITKEFETLGEVTKVAVRHPNSDITVKEKGTWCFEHSAGLAEWLSYYDNFYTGTDFRFKEFNIYISVYTENDMNTLVIHKDEYESHHPAIGDDDSITPLKFDEIERYTY